MAPDWVERLCHRSRTVLPFALIGVACVIAGGLVAAVVAHSPTQHEVWAVAYLVLVPGVAQVALGTCQALLADRVPTDRMLTAQLLTWNVGNAAVIAGTVGDAGWGTALGGALLVVALALFLTNSRGARSTWLLQIYRLLVAVILVSVPIGLIVQQVKGD
ncbi:hypothetical protein [Leekyejoonella antrihumi]|uniref:Uncharacterized protein n=1 Tax=Leekyejoonella antrihumi TaxID=1660198 RepID=A0A563E2C1_9MICO|nr:hypothetical protein [Leekyejoonella antrihumi]TWP36351.1 hypothetical protein FGL98_10320 [Leekyejoonella antrihumi]